MVHVVFFFQLALSAVLGGLVGWQREHIGKHAGIRTYALVSFGATLFTILSVKGFGDMDQTRIAAQIITGIGFIGAGTIIHKEGGVEGLTTAAGLWAIAAVGMAVGVGWYVESIIASLLMFLILLIHDKKFFK